MKIIPNDILVEAIKKQIAKPLRIKDLPHRSFDHAQKWHLIRQKKVDRHCYAQTMLRNLNKMQGKLFEVRLIMQELITKVKIRRNEHNKRTIILTDQNNKSGGDTFPPVF